MRGFADCKAGNLRLVSSLAVLCGFNVTVFHSMNVGISDNIS